MPKIPRAVPNAESNQPHSPLQIRCRICHQVMTINLSEEDFFNEHGHKSVIIFKIIECAICGTMNPRYFSWEIEFPDFGIVNQGS